MKKINKIRIYMITTGITVFIIISSIILIPHTQQVEKTESITNYKQVLAPEDTVPTIRMIMMNGDNNTVLTMTRSNETLIATKHDSNYYGSSIVFFGIITDKHPTPIDVEYSLYGINKINGTYHMDYNPSIESLKMGTKISIASYSYIITPTCIEHLDFDHGGFVTDIPIQDFNITKIPNYKVYKIINNGGQCKMGWSYTKPWRNELAVQGVGIPLSPPYYISGGITQ